MIRGGKVRTEETIVVRRLQKESAASLVLLNLLLNKNKVRIPTNHFEDILDRRVLTEVSDSTLPVFYINDRN